jgi:hypothetical protein
MNTTLTTARAIKAALPNNCFNVYLTRTGHESAARVFDARTSKGVLQVRITVAGDLKWVPATERVYQA